MKERIIGDKRKFDTYPGDWEITEILKDKSVNIPLRLNNTRCKHCGNYFDDIKPYEFDYIEVLKNNDRTIHLAVTKRDNTGNSRYVLLEDYMNDDNITNKKIEMKAK
jgi:hypothetical protein